MEFVVIYKKLKERRIKINKNISTKDWLLVDKILENGIIRYKNNYIKIIKVIPINYDLKSNLEKEAILNSYKLFLKTCDFNIQILIQSRKENLSKHISKIQILNENEENEKIKDIVNSYIYFIEQKNDENKSSSKNFFILIKYIDENFSKNSENAINNHNLAISNLNESYFKIKETLSRCGNLIYDVDTRKETENILISFFNPKINN